MSSTSVSAVVFAHAPYARFLPGCLESVLTQSCPPVEIVVLSDGSQAIAEVVGNFSDSRLSLVDQGEGHFFLALNRVAAGCGGECIALLDSDDLYKRDHLKVLVELFARDPDLGLAFDNVEYFAGAGADGCKESPGAAAEENLLISSAVAKKLAGRPLSVREIFIDNLITGPSSLLRRSAFVRVGGYDQNALVIGDLHLFYRIGAYYGIGFADYVGVQKRVHRESTTGSNPHYEYGVEGLESIRDHYPEVYRRIGRRAFDKKLGRKYFRLGLYYEKSGELEKARAAYKKAMRLRKLSFRYGWEYCRSTVAASLMS